MIACQRKTWLPGKRLVLVASTTLFAGCSTDDIASDSAIGSHAGLQSSSTASIQGELLARVDLTKTHYVEFRALPDGNAGVGILEFGRHGDAPLDRAEWDALGPEGVYQRLAAHAAPEAIARASREMRQKQVQLPELTTVAEIELPSNRVAAGKPPVKLGVALPVDRTKTVPARGNDMAPADGGGSQTIDELGKSTQALFGDAAWWQANFCGTGLDVDLDSVWCPTNAGWVSGGTRYTMFYNAAGMSAPGGQGANFLVEYYDWAAATWRTAYSITLVAGQWVSYTWQGEVTFRSSISGVNNTAVHFMDKYRRQVTYLSHYSHHPSDIGWDFGNDIQGVATDGSAWYMSRTEYGLDTESDYGALARIPIGTDLNNEPSYVRTEPSGWRGSYTHYGAISYRSGRLYVPVDGPAGCGVGVFLASDLSTFGVQSLDSSGNCGWLAYNPRDNRFYGPLESKGAENIFKYDIQVSPPNWVIGKYGSVTTSFPIDRIAGGAFSPRGVLWVFTGFHTSPLNLYAVDVRNGFVYHRASYSVSGDLDDWEAEGVTVFDLMDGRAPGIRGHVHVQLLRNDIFSDDNWWFAHLVANDPAAL